jgi:transposase
MQAYLDEFAKSIKKDVILVMDNAAWHKALVVPKNIEIVYLPPYSPELNPVERLWKYMKDKLLKNKVYQNLKDLEQETFQFVKDLSGEAISSICRCNYIL